MKKRLLIGRIIGFIGICIFAMGLSYTVTYYMDKVLYEDISLLVTFEDTETFKLENTSKLEKTEALNTYPYIFSIENNGLGSVTYQIKIQEDVSNVEKNLLSYILYLNDEEVKEGLLSDLEDDVLYTSKIKAKQTATYKLYIYLNEEKDDVSFEYSLEIESL